MNVTKNPRFGVHRRGFCFLAEAGEGLVGTYGDPNAGIRAYGKNSDKTGGEVARRDRR